MLSTKNKATGCWHIQQVHVGSRSPWPEDGLLSVHQEVSPLVVQSFFLDGRSCHCKRIYTVLHTHWCTQKTLPQRVQKGVGVSFMPWSALYHHPPPTMTTWPYPWTVAGESFSWHGHSSSRLQDLQCTWSRRPASANKHFLWYLQWPPSPLHWRVLPSVSH